MEVQVLTTEAKYLDDNASKTAILSFLVWQIDAAFSYWAEPWVFEWTRMGRGRPSVGHV
jgi:hypothetical protein